MQQKYRKEVFSDGCLKVTLLTPEEAETYRNMQNGINIDANVIRSVAEENGEKRILETTADGFSITSVKSI